MDNYKFSVAMSIYKNDDPSQLNVALDSICSQSLSANEIFLVIDGPIPQLLEDIILKYSNLYNNFTIHRLEKNGGLGNALRIAVEKCKYDLIIRMDSDDISAPGRFERQISEYIKQPADVIGGWTLGFFGDLLTGNISEFKPPITDSEIKHLMKHSSAVSHVTVLLDRKAVLKSGNYQDLFYHEDYYLWVRMIEKGCSFRNIPEYLVYVRCGEGQAKRHGGKKYYLAEKTLRKYMLEKKLITKFEYRKEMFLRYIYQRLMTPFMRCFVDKKIKRKYLDRAFANSIIEKGVKTDV